MKQIILMLMLVILLLPFAAASSDCPCLRPGAGGVIVKFLARTGTTENVTLYPEYTRLEAGFPINIYAAKNISGEVVIIENLSVSMYLDSVKTAEKKTNSGGMAQFAFDAPGRYDFIGGDANVSFDVVESAALAETDEVPETNSSLLGTNSSLLHENSSIPPLGSNNTITQGSQRSSAPAPVRTHRTDYFPYIALAALAAVVGLLLFKNHQKRGVEPKGKKTGFKNKMLKKK